MYRQCRGVYYDTTVVVDGGGSVEGGHVDVYDRVEGCHVDVHA